MCASPASLDPATRWSARPRRPSKNLEMQIDMTWCECAVPDVFAPRWHASPKPCAAGTPSPHDGVMAFRKEAQGRSPTPTLTKVDIYSPTIMPTRKVGIPKLDRKPALTLTRRLLLRPDQLPSKLGHQCVARISMLTRRSGARQVINALRSASLHTVPGWALPIPIAKMESAATP